MDEEARRAALSDPARTVGVVEMTEVPRVHLEPWSEDDFDLLRAANSPEMTDHLGGPESEEQLVARHRRYLDRPAIGGMFRIVLVPQGEAIGTTGFWARSWGGAMVYETGYGILPRFRGRGLAVAAAVGVIRLARSEHEYRYLHAFPSVEHAASNAVCRRAGFEFVGECEFEYPKGTFIRSNDWRVDLAASEDG